MNGPAQLAAAHATVYREQKKGFWLRCCAAAVNTDAVAQRDTCTHGGYTFMTVIHHHHQDE